MTNILRLLLCFCCCLEVLFGVEPDARWTHDDLMRDLLTVREIDQKNSDRLPVLYNNFLESGYINMPSALVNTDGCVSFGYSLVPPYRNWNTRLQFFEHIEVVGNYRIFEGVPDPVLSKFGFGDFSDKGASVKVVLWTPEDSGYSVPGAAIGTEDFTGTMAFNSQYIVFTQVWPERHLEASLGYGNDRLGGFFGGAQWMPWRKHANRYIKGLAFVAEYDSTNYKNPSFERHPDGRNQSSSFNYGLKYRYGNYLDLSVSRVRGEETAMAGSISYPLGTTEGFLTKIEDPLPYRFPVNRQALGHMRPPEAMMHALQYAMKEKGFTVLEGWLGVGPDKQKTLRIRLLVEDFRREGDVLFHLNHLLSRLIPSDIDEVIIEIDNGGLVVHEYRYLGDALRRYHEKKIGPYELDILTLRRHPTQPDPQQGETLFHQSNSTLDWRIAPRTRTFFGSSRGKFKYSLGLDLELEGYLWGDVYYNLVLGKVFVENMKDVQDTDMLNRSLLINVRTDQVNYEKNNGLFVTTAFLQKSWHAYRGIYTRAAVGYFEEAYGGVAFEALYMPVDQNWAVGWESALLKKREYTGLGFTDQVRFVMPDYKFRFEKFCPHQYFLEGYYYLDAAQMRCKVSAGRFLAKDYGVRLEVSRVFKSGFEVSLWYTRTTARDIVNHSRYHDRGVSVSVPLDIFYQHSSRKKLNYGMSAWLRDVGIRSETGNRLYDAINEERQ